MITLNDREITMRSMRGARDIIRAGMMIKRDLEIN